MLAIPTYPCIRCGKDAPRTGLGYCAACDAELAAITVENGYYPRTARKEHRCHQCGQPIARGARYIEYLGATPAYQSGERYHPACLGLEEA